MARDHDQLDVAVGHANAANAFDAVDPVHLPVDDDHIGPFVHDEFEPSLHADALTEGFDPRLDVEGDAERFAEGTVVVDHQHPQGVRHEPRIQIRRHWSFPPSFFVNSRWITKVFSLRAEARA